MQRVALDHGLILVDTKYEFGKGADGKIYLIDEVSDSFLVPLWQWFYFSQLRPHHLLPTFRCIHLTQADIGLLILIRNAFRVVLSLKISTRFLTWLKLNHYVLDTCSCIYLKWIREVENYNYTFTLFFPVSLWFPSMLSLQYADIYYNIWLGILEAVVQKSLQPIWGWGTL